MMYLLFFLLALLCEVIGTVGGFGSSVFFVPILGLVFDFRIVLALTGILHVFSNVSKLIIFRKYIKLKLVYTIGIPSIIFVIFGAWLTAFIDFKYAELFLGIFLLIFGLLLLFIPTVSITPGFKSQFFAGSVSGFLTGFVGTGGAIRGLALAALDLEKNIFVATSAAVDMGVDISRTAIYLQNDFLDVKYLSLIPALIIASFVGSYIGKKIIDRISQEKFKGISLVLISLIGILLITKVLYKEM